MRILVVLLALSCLGQSTATIPLPDIVVSAKDLAGNIVIDTETFTSTSCDVQQGYIPGPGTYRLIHFAVVRQNIGKTDLNFGDPTTSSFYQPPVNPSCSSYCFRYPDRYHLWTAAAYKQWSGAGGYNPNLPVTGTNNEQKLKAYIAAGSLRVTFKRVVCLEDEEPVNPKNPSPITNLHTCTNQGLSKGWGDRYGSFQTGQYIDITGLPAGSYVLEIIENPDHMFGESNYLNNTATVKVTLN